MMPSGPHRSTIGTGERSSIPTVVFRLCGHPEIGPKPAADQSREPIRAPISPPPKGKLSLFPELAMYLLETGPRTQFYCEDTLCAYTSKEQPYLLITFRSTSGALSASRPVRSADPLFSQQRQWRF